MRGAIGRARKERQKKAQRTHGGCASAPSSVEAPAAASAIMPLLPTAMSAMASWISWLPPYKLVTFNSVLDCFQSFTGSPLPAGQTAPPLQVLQPARSTAHAQIDMKKQLMTTTPSDAPQYNTNASMASPLPLEMLRTFASAERSYLKQKPKGVLLEMCCCQQENEFGIGRSFGGWTLDGTDEFYLIEDASFACRFCCAANRQTRYLLSQGGKVGGVPFVEYKRPLRCPIGCCKCCCFQVRSTYRTATGAARWNFLRFVFSAPRFHRGTAGALGARGGRLNARGRAREAVVLR